MSEAGVIPPPGDRHTYVHQVDEVRDMDEDVIVVGVDYDTVTLSDDGGLHIWRFSQAEAEEFAQAFIAACWDAGRNAERMRQEATMPP